MFQTVPLQLAVFLGGSYGSVPRFGSRSLKDGVFSVVFLSVMVTLNAGTAPYLLLWVLYPDGVEYLLETIDAELTARYRGLKSSF